MGIIKTSNMKQLVRRVILMTLILVAAGSFNSCNNDDDAFPGRPTITALEGINTVILGESKDFTFTASIPGGYRSHSFAVANGSIIETPMVDKQGARQVSLGVNFLGLDQGAALIQLTVTDRFGQTDKKSMTLEVFESN